MLKDIFKKLNQNKFGDLEILSDGGSLNNENENDNYVYFFMPGERDLETKFRVALTCFQNKKIGFGRFYLSSAYEESTSNEWILAKSSHILFDCRADLLLALQNLVDAVVFSLARKMEWTLPVFHLFHQFFYMNKAERSAFFKLPFDRKKTLVLRTLEYLPHDFPVQKTNKFQFYQLIGDLSSNLVLISEIYDLLAELSTELGQLYLFTR